MITVEKKPLPRVRQGDILRDIEYIEYVNEEEGVIEVSKIVFPLVIVLTQDCDLLQDFNSRNDEAATNQDKWLLSVLVAPLYNAEHVYTGEHLKDIDNITMATVPRKGNTGSFLFQNKRPRYHYLEFPDSVPVVTSIIDFKHYFSVNMAHLEKLKPTNFVCSVSELYREDISQRFASFLSRVGLP